MSASDLGMTEAQALERQAAMDDVAWHFGVYGRDSGPVAKLPPPELRGMFGVWWFLGNRIERNFQGMYVLQNGEVWCDFDQLCIFIADNDLAERNGWLDPIPDVFGWLGEGEPAEPRSPQGLVVDPVTIILFCGAAGFLLGAVFF